jgi:phosphoadenosine phosphosulfate reductase
MQSGEAMRATPNTILKSSEQLEDTSPQDILRQSSETMRATPNTILKLSKQLEDASPQDILRWASETYGDQLAVVTSFQITGIVTLHMLQDIAPQTPVLTLDTGYLFPETYDLIDTLEDQFNLNLTRIRPRQTTKQQARDYGDRLWERNPDRCCHLRKTIPLRDALEGYDSWITGLRRDQSSSRANTRIVDTDQRTGLIKIAPFANWTEDMLWTYIHAYELPYNTLHEVGYPSIGCWSCTKAVTDTDDARSGRWSSNSKTECGIHVELVKEGTHV